MSNYIVEKYAGMLNEEDVNTLFKLLIEQIGNNRSKAARRCGVTGKATYDWENAAYVKLGTKKKVLEASLRENFLSTMEYLLNRSNDQNIDMLQNILSTLYADALDATTLDCFKQALTQFDTIRMNNLGKIRDGLQNEVTDMTQTLRNKAAELGVPVPAKSIDEFSAEETVRVFSIIGKAYSVNPSQAETLAQKTIQLPSNIITPVLHTFKMLCGPKELHITTADKEDADVKQLAAGNLSIGTTKTLEYRRSTSSPNIWEFSGANDIPVLLFTEE